MSYDGQEIYFLCTNRTLKASHERHHPTSHEWRGREKFTRKVQNIRFKYEYIFYKILRGQIISIMNEPFLCESINTKDILPTTEKSS